MLVWPTAGSEFFWPAKNFSSLKEVRKTFKLFVDSMPGTADSMKALIRAMIPRCNAPWLCLESRRFEGPIKMLKVHRTFVRKLVEWGHLLPEDSPDREPLMRLMFGQIPHWLIESVRMTRVVFPRGWPDENEITNEVRHSFFLHAAKKLAFAYVVVNVSRSAPVTSIQAT